MSGELLYRDLQYRDPRQVVRMLRDGLANELAGLNEDEAVEALVHARDRLIHWLAIIGLSLAFVEIRDERNEMDDNA